MILNDDEIEERIESPLNLLNRLRTSLSKTSGLPERFAPRLPPSGSHPVSHPSIPPKSSDLIDDLESKITNSSARGKAMGIMLSAMDELKARLPEVQKPERLASIAVEMSRVLNHQEPKNGNSISNSQIIVYAPQVQRLDSFEILDVIE